MGSPAIFEGNESGVLTISAAEVENAQSVPFGFLDRSPEQQMDAAEALRIRVGTAVLIDQRILVAERQDRCDRLPILERNSNLQRFSKTIDQVLEPSLWLRKDNMSTPGKKVQVIETLKQDC